MSTAKKCYNCFTETAPASASCPRCGVKLGPLTASGCAARPPSALPRVLLGFAVLAIVGLAVYGRGRRPETPKTVQIISSKAGTPDRSAVIRSIREKGAAELQSIGVTDIGYDEDAFCVYVDQRFAKLSEEQQEQVLALVAGEWKKALGQASTAVKILKQGSGAPLASFTI